MSKILVVAPHPDDEMIGVGGTIIKNIENGNEVFICVVTKGTHPLFDEETVKKTREECKTCHDFLGIKETFFLDFPAAMLETVPRIDLNNSLLKVVEQVKPDVVFIPHHGDMQKDHQIVSDAMMVVLRPKYFFAPKQILEYEVLSETGWNIPNCQNEFIPNVFIDVSNFLEDKINACSFYKSQMSLFPSTRSLKAIEYLARYRGSLMHLSAAEAFCLVREIG